MYWCTFNILQWPKVSTEEWYTPLHSHQARSWYYEQLETSLPKQSTWSALPAKKTIRKNEWCMDISVLFYWTHISPNGTLEKGGEKNSPAYHACHALVTTPAMDQIRVCYFFLTEGYATWNLPAKKSHLLQKGYAAFSIYWLFKSWQQVCMNAWDRYLSSQLTWKNKGPKNVMEGVIFTVRTHTDVVPHR